MSSWSAWSTGFPSDTFEITSGPSNWALAIENLVQGEKFSFGGLFVVGMENGKRTYHPQGGTLQVRLAGMSDATGGFHSGTRGAWAIEGLAYRDTDDMVLFKGFYDAQARRGELILNLAPIANV